MLCIPEKANRSVSLPFERMARVAVPRVEAEVEREEGEAEPLVLPHVAQLVPPDRLARLARGDDDVAERDRGEAAPREDEPREAAVAHVEEAVVAEPRARAREGSEQVAERVGVVLDEDAGSAQRDRRTRARRRERTSARPCVNLYGGTRMRRPPGSPSPTAGRSCSVLVVGLTFGVVARQAGFALLEISATSWVIFGGASQFVAIELLRGGAGAGTVILAALLINLRHLPWRPPSAATSPAARCSSGSGSGTS